MTRRLLRLDKEKKHLHTTRRPLRLHIISLYIKNESFQRMTENMNGVLDNLTNKFWGNLRKLSYTITNY